MLARRTIMAIAAAIAALMAAQVPASAHGAPRAHHHRFEHHRYHLPGWRTHRTARAPRRTHHVARRMRYAQRFRDGRPRAWCGWYMRQALGVSDTRYNLARNWAHYGHAGAPGIGAIVVWAHHVGRIVAGAPGHWIINSGNDGHAVRTRERSLAHVIAIRWS